MSNGSAVVADSVRSFGNFDLIKRVELRDNDIVVSKWQSRVTGLTVVHLDHEAPLVNGYFVVATEIFDDSGCPHTLEHLVFMGSEKYPYKGIIDHLANRGFSNGTNAWTDTDHTAYTSSTAGDQGFLQLLPVFLDHILYPTMVKSAFLTEVYHINGKGEDAGVVYSEMQGRQNTSADLMALCSQRTLYPVGSAYRSETGGLMEALRLLTVEQIRKYHGTYYVPHNLSLIVTGKLSNGTQSLLSVIQDKVEPTIIAHGQNRGPRPDGWKRPFMETPSANRAPIQQSVKKVVEFPEKDESQGELVITFCGPSPTNFLDQKALDILATYLTSSPVAPLNKEYVEVESPLCSYIYFSEDTRATMVDLPIYIGSIPVEHIDDFDQKFVSSLRRISREGIDMDRMRMVINRDERQLRSKLESSKGETLSGALITDFLYGALDGSDLPDALDEMKYYNVLRMWSSKDWSNLLNKYFVDANYVAIIGKPSAHLAEKLERDEKARLAVQVEKLGPEGLAQAKKDLEAAKEEHEKPIPKDVLTSFPVPDVKSISWIPVESVQETSESFDVTRTQSSLAKHIESDGSPLPMFIQYDHVKSDFVSIHAYFSLANVPDRLRPHISTYLAAFFSLPVKRTSGQHLSHEEVVNKLDDETVAYESALGVSEQFTEMLRVTLKVQVGQYESAVAWLRDLIWGAIFDKERLLVSAAKIAQSLPELKRDGNNVLSSVWMECHFSANSTSLASAVLSQSEFVPKLIEELRETPDKVIADFEALRTYLTDPSGVRFSVTGNVLGVTKPRSVWGKYFGSLPKSRLTPIRFSYETLNDLGRNPAGKATVVSLPTIESSFVSHTARGIQGFDHPEFPALRVALEVLNATESYLWRSIRGSGLAYGAYVTADREAGLLSFILYRSSDSIAAFKEARKVLTGLIDGTVELEETTLDAAKSSIVYGVARNVATPGTAATNSFLDQAIKGVPQGYNLKLLEQYQAVTKSDVLASLKKHVLPIFSSSSSTVVVVTTPSKVDQIAGNLEEFGFKPEKRTLEVVLEDGTDDDSSSETGSQASHH
ncbi:Metalloenzyme, LuxS/M16 peptidase-like protein [Pisolithus orientalis]|uniref:Metalloenzyme, LuxS/M16 peptidase-like protein n=1 Tax=Pisolithus orientalis TaxID=936130 RepID=UPI0022242C81|nr:Metalloenzyme, LuxS/M16 peptidase-like protein [Pisolithus orientalis]KAI6005289.1 Metalloenzyme, LuxS/M16 peptidase-like protein [Pisolithus orientalis]